MKIAAKIRCFAVIHKFFLSKFAVIHKFREQAVGVERMFVLVYWPEAATSRHYLGPKRKDCFKFYITLPEDLCETGGAMHVYVWFQAPSYHRAGEDHDQVFIDHASPSRYLGTF